MRYRISVRGRLTERLGSAFEGMVLEPTSGHTALVGEIRDDVAAASGEQMMAALCRLPSRVAASRVSAPR
jgi:hypothetical protein